MTVLISSSSQRTIIMENSSVQKRKHLYSQKLKISHMGKSWYQFCLVVIYVVSSVALYLQGRVVTWNTFQRMDKEAHLLMIY